MRRRGEEDPTGYTEEELSLHFQDVRDELELSGHNLTSVLNNPRETFIDSLYEAAFEAEPPLPDMDVVRANVPQGLRDIAPQVGLACVGYSIAAVSSGLRGYHESFRGLLHQSLYGTV